MESLDMFDIVIGLEIHAELNTKTKIFCGCKNEYGAIPNTNVCPVCTGMPGALPVLNKRALELGIKAGLSFGCKISQHTVFERKNYFYPDLSKAYQISQLVYPICIGGSVKLKSGKVIRLNRIHLEEDAGKLVHISRSEGTLIDYNRAGTPLIEMVTEADFSSAAEAVEFLKRVREILTFEDIAKCKMEEGGMRCDVNLSLKPKGQRAFGTRTEMKNLNSFKSVQRAIEYEAQRQAEILLEGGKIDQETRKWDDASGRSFSMRSKANAQDYRYFPEPDLPPVKILEKDIQRVQSGMVELPDQRRIKYITQFGLPLYDSEILTLNKYISDYFEECVSYYFNPKKISNWIMVDLLKFVNLNDGDTFPISAKNLAKIIKMVEEKVINKTLGLQLIEEIIKIDRDPEGLAKELGMLVTITDQQIISLFNKLKKENPKVVDDYKEKPEKVIAYITGYVMKNTQGKANSVRVKELIPQEFK